MSGVNKAIIIGRCGKDPETRNLPSGGTVTEVSVATSEKWKDKQGQQQEKTEWHNVVFFGKLAEIAGQYLKKGGEVYVEGSISTEKWQDKQGNDRYTTKIKAHTMQMLGGRPATAPAQDQHNQAKSNGYAPEPAGDGFFDDDLDF